MGADGAATVPEGSQQFGRGGGFVDPKGEDASLHAKAYVSTCKSYIINM